MTGRGLLNVALAGLALTLAQSSAMAGTSIVVDASSGRVLHNEDATRPWYPASLSKLMTAYVVFKAIRDGRISADTPITISARAAKMAPSKMGYPPGTQVTVDNALKMLIVHSANDIAVALAEGVSGSVERFAAEMNANSQALGMGQSHWVNPNGLPDPGQVSSARDMAVLARALLVEFPQYAPLYSIQAIQSGKRVMRTHNALVYRYPGAEGMKTGFICAAGFNVVATASRGGQRLITVVMGSPSAKARTIEAAGLFEANFGSGGSATLSQLPASAYATPPDIRDVACGRKKGGEDQAEREDMAEIKPPPAAPITPPNVRQESVYAALVAQPQPPQAQPQAPPSTEDLLLSNWVMAPPVPVGPYKGPKRPAKVAPDPVTSFAAPGAALGAIRPGATPAIPQAPLPGQIRRANANPLENLASDPLPVDKKPAKQRGKAAGAAKAESVPLPAPRPAKAKKKPQPPAT